MVRSAATTVQAYLDELPPERRAVIAAVREVIVKNLPAGYREAIGRLVASTSVEQYIAIYEASRRRP